MLSIGFIFSQGGYEMLHGRNIFIAVVCVGMLATAAMGMSDRPDTQADSSMDTKKQVPSQVIGEVLHIQDELYLIRESSGKEVSLRVDDSSQVAGRLKKGDFIVAEVKADGHVRKIQKANVTH
jgi:hypothetical protein